MVGCQGGAAGSSLTLAQWDGDARVGFIANCDDATPGATTETAGEYLAACRPGPVARFPARGPSAAPALLAWASGHRYPEGAGGCAGEGAGGAGGNLTACTRCATCYDCATYRSTMPRSPSPTRQPPRRVHFLATPEQVRWLKQQGNAGDSLAAILRGLISEAMARGSRS
jgi:hypothetical protein